MSEGDRAPRPPRDRVAGGSDSRRLPDHAEQTGSIDLARLMLPHPPCSPHEGYGTIGLLRSTEVPSPTISVYAWFACWQMYSNSSVSASHRRFDVPVNGAV